MSARRRDLVVLALLMGLALPTTAIGKGIVSVVPPAVGPGATIVVAFRAPHDQYDELDGEEHDDYEMSLHGPSAGCSLVAGVLDNFGDVLINGRVTVLKYGGGSSGHQIQ